MRLTDVLGQAVADERGRLLGVVTDVRLIQNGPKQGEFGRAFRIHGLVVGPHRVGAHLGFDRANVRGPWLLKALFNRIQRGQRYAPWALVRSIGPKKITIAVPDDGLLASVPPK